MRPTLLVALAAAAALVAGQSIAQDEHAAHHPAPAADAKAPPAADAKAPPAKDLMAGMDPAAMHEMCKSVMGDKMDAKNVHHQLRDKSGFGMHKMPPTKAEMAAMHEKCAAMMKDEHAAAAPK